MIAVDANILVYAHRRDVPEHAAAVRCLRALAEGAAPWAIPWPAIHEFLSVVTRPRAFSPPTPMPLAVDAADRWLSSPSAVPLSETSVHWAQLRPLAERVRGSVLYDARIAAICLAHGVRELWTADRDYGRFPALRTRNPLAD